MSIFLDLHSYADPERAKTLQRFFQTKPGGYGEGDIFLGLKTPLLRQIIKKYTHLNLSDLQELLDSPIHECRMAGLFILIRQNIKADP